jgi:hypothetical protein
MVLHQGEAVGNIVIAPIEYNIISTLSYHNFCVHVAHDKPAFHFQMTYKEHFEEQIIGLRLLQNRFTDKDFECGSHVTQVQFTYVNPLQ